MAIERLEVQRTIPVEPSTIFALLSDPKGHVAIDPVLSEGALRATLGILARTATGVAGSG